MTKCLPPPDWKRKVRRVDSEKQHGVNINGHIMTAFKFVRGRIPTLEGQREVNQQCPHGYGTYLFYRTTVVRDLRYEIK